MKENWPTSKLTLFTYVVAPLSYFFNTWSKIHVDLSYSFVFVLAYFPTQ